MTNFANSYATRLSAYLLDDALTCTVDSVVGDPAVPYNAIIQRKNSFPDEIVTVTNVTGSVLTITRATEAVAGVQTAYDHPVGAVLRHIVTARGLLTAEYVNVKAFGATGDGTTDDTAAITATIAALPAVGGTLYFPAGTYSTSGGFTLSVPCTVRGEGSTSEHDADGTGARITQVECTSRTAILFNVTADLAKFVDIALVNAAALVPTAGAGIAADSGTYDQRVDCDSIAVVGFYDNVLQNGAHWRVSGCHINGPVRYGLYIRNAVVPDVGDWSVSDCWFGSSLRNSTSAIRIESASGGKITNCKLNGAGLYRYGTGVDIHFDGDGVGSGLFLIGNTSIENVTEAGVSIVAANDAGVYQVSVIGCQFSVNAGDTSAHSVVATGTGATLERLMFVGNHFSGPAESGAAIVLTDCGVVNLAGNRIAGYTSLYSTAGTVYEISDDARPATDAKHHAPGTNITVTSTTKVVLAAELECTITLPFSRRVLVGWTLSAWNDTPGRTMAVDVLLDDTLYLSDIEYGGAGYGLLIAGVPLAACAQNMSGTVMTHWLTAGVHTFNLVFKVDGGTTVVSAAQSINPIKLWVQEQSL